MFWIRVDADVADSPKIGDLARTLGITRDAALALLVKWWGWVARHKPDGDLSGVSPEDIAEGCRWRGNPDRLRSALCATRLLDGDGKVHDWHDMNGRQMSEAERKREYRQRLRQERDEAVRARVRGQCPDMSHGQNGTRPRLTTPHHTTPNGQQETTALSAKADPPAPGLADEFRLAWNAQVANVPKVKDWSMARAAKFKVRLANDYFRNNWRAALAKIGTSAFLQGGGSTGWRASVDWFLQADSVTKIMEGKYDGGNGSGKKSLADHAREWEAKQAAAQKQEEDDDAPGF